MGSRPVIHPTRRTTRSFRMFNARSETLAEKPAFGRLLARKRAVVLLSGFYEWRDEGGRGRDAVKQPYYLHLSDDAPRPLRCAALYDRWARANEPEPVTTVTIVTVPASGPIDWLHDRMPAVLASDEDVAAWLMVDDGEKRATKTNLSTTSRIASRTRRVAPPVRREGSAVVPGDDGDE